MTCRGSSAEICSTKSADPASHTLSMMESAAATTLASRSRIIRGVKPLLTSRRYRVCMGGSMLSIIIRCWARASSSMSVNRAPDAVGREVLVVTVDADAVVIAGDRPEPFGEAVGVRVPLDRGLTAEIGEPLVGDRRPRSWPSHTGRYRSTSMVPPLWSCSRPPDSGRHGSLR